MEEDEYRSTYHQFNQTRCAFEKAILSRRVSCRHAHKFCLAEREGVSCQSATHQQRCLHFLQQARQNALFALKLTQLDGALPHAKEMRVQLGSLIGVAEKMDGQPPETINDADDLLARAELAFDGLDELPFDSIVRAIKRIQGRRRRDRKQ